MIQWHSFTQSLNRKIYATASRSFDAISYDILNRLKVIKISSRKIAVWKHSFVLFNAYMKSSVVNITTADVIDKGAVINSKIYSLGSKLQALL